MKGKKRDWERSVLFCRGEWQRWSQNYCQLWLGWGRRQDWAGAACARAGMHQASSIKAVVLGPPCFSGTWSFLHVGKGIATPTGIPGDQWMSREGRGMGMMHKAPTREWCDGKHCRGNQKCWWLWCWDWTEYSQSALERKFCKGEGDEEPLLLYRGLGSQLRDKKLQENLSHGIPWRWNVKTDPRHRAFAYRGAPCGADTWQGQGGEEGTPQPKEKFPCVIQPE